MVDRPIHRQFGSKARVADRILSLVPPGRRVWIEVFAGSAAITFAKAPHPVEHINDLSGHIVNLFRVVRDPALRIALQEVVSMTPYAAAELWDCAAEIRHDDPVKRLAAGGAASESDSRLGPSDSFSPRSK